MTECYRCGQEGHTRSKCPDAFELPADGPAESRPSKLPGYGVPVPWFPPADPEATHRGARAVREAAGWALPGADDPLVRTPFREHARLPLRTESELRMIAAAQLTRKADAEWHP